MSLFGSYVLFSELTGEVLLGNSPVTGARVVQKVYKSNSEEIVAETVTDSSGNFSFKEISEKKGLLSFLPGEFVATQRLYIFYEDKEYFGWGYTKRDSAANSESNGNPMIMRCDLSKEPEEDDELTGICRLVGS